MFSESCVFQLHDPRCSNLFQHTPKLAWSPRCTRKAVTGAPPVSCAEHWRGVRRRDKHRWQMVSDGVISHEIPFGCLALLRRGPLQRDAPATGSRDSQAEDLARRASANATRGEKKKDSEKTAGSEQSSFSFFSLILFLFLFFFGESVPSRALPAASVVAHTAGLALPRAPLFYWVSVSL